MTPAQAAATVAATFPSDSPEAQLARDRLDALAEAERNAMTTDPYGSPYFHTDDPDTTKRLGTPLRDAAVDPHPDDIGPAGDVGDPGPDGNPHGPKVFNAVVGTAEYQRQVDLSRKGLPIR